MVSECNTSLPSGCPLSYIKNILFKCRFWFAIWRGVRGGETGEKEECVRLLIWLRVPSDVQRWKQLLSVMRALKKKHKVNFQKSRKEKVISPSKESAVRSIWVQIYVYTRAWPRACCRPCIPRAGRPVPTWVFGMKTIYLYFFITTLEVLEIDCKGQQS